MKEDKYVKENIIKQNLINVWNSTKGIIGPKVSSLASPSNIFHVADNYSKKNIIVYVDMVNSDSANLLKRTT